MYNDPIYQKAIKEVSIKHNIPVEVVTVAYRSYWEFIKATAQALELKVDLTEEEFNKLRPNFNIPSLGKLYVTWEKYINTKKRRVILENLKFKNDKA